MALKCKVGRLVAEFSHEVPNKSGTLSRIKGSDIHCLINIDLDGSRGILIHTHEAMAPSDLFEDKAPSVTITTDTIEEINNKGRAIFDGINRQIGKVELVAERVIGADGMAHYTSRERLADPGWELSEFQLDVHPRHTDVVDFSHLSSIVGETLILAIITKLSNLGVMRMMQAQLEAQLSESTLKTETETEVEAEAPKRSRRDHYGTW